MSKTQAWCLESSNSKVFRIVVDDERKPVQHELMLYQKSSYLSVDTVLYVLVIFELCFFMWTLLNLILKY